MTTPLIKGMFINSHIKALQRAKGDVAIAELSRRFGQPPAFNNLDDYPVRIEVALLEIILDIMNDTPVANRSFEAGRLHFRNFVTTPFGRILVSTLPKTPDGFQKLLLSVKHIVRHVFKHTNFGSEKGGTNSLIISMENSDYPIDHFRGLFYEWMSFWNLPEPRVQAHHLSSKRFEYTLSWKIESV